MLTYVSAPLEHDVAIAGPVAATLFASTSGTDSDMVVKLIDVYPENATPNAWDAEAGPKPGEYAHSVNGYELPVAMEVRRGRYNTSYEHPKALVANAPVEWKISRGMTAVDENPPSSNTMVTSSIARSSGTATSRQDPIRETVAGPRAMGSVRLDSGRSIRRTRCSAWGGVMGVFLFGGRRT